jgi:hypothetical protein
MPDKPGIYIARKKKGGPANLLFEVGGTAPWLRILWILDKEQKRFSWVPTEREITGLVSNAVLKQSDVVYEYEIEGEDRLDEEDYEDAT